MRKKYYVVRDCQCGEFGMHRLGSLKYWREQAIEWAESDESFELVRALKKYEIKNSELIDYISEYWQLEFKETENINDYIKFETSCYSGVRLEKYLNDMIDNKEITEKDKINYLKMIINKVMEYERFNNLLYKASKDI